MIHHCHANGCAIEVERRMLMCKQHWFALPKHMRKAVWDSYAAAGGTDGPIEDLQHEAYWRACANAVEFICKMEGKPLANGYRNVATRLAQKRLMELAERRIKARRVRRDDPRSLIPGERVRHEIFGLGAVVEVSEGTVTVSFDDHGEKVLATMFRSKLSRVGKLVLRPSSRERKP